MLFVTEGGLELARHDDTYPRSEIRPRLLEAARRHLGTSVEDLRKIGRHNNLFKWEMLVSELSLASALSDDGRMFDHLLTVVRSLADGAWKTARFDDDIHVPWVLTALAGFYDLHQERLDEEDADSLRATMAAMAEYVSGELETQRWGSPELIFWNHTLIGYSGIGVAGLVLDDHPRASGWVETAMERIGDFLDRGLTHSGMNWEGLQYCGFDFKHVGAFLRGLEARGIRAQLVPPGSERELRLRNVPVRYAHDSFPRGGWMQAYNDANWNPAAALQGFLLTFAEYEPGLCGAVWDRLVGAEGLATYGHDSRNSTLAEALVFFPPGAVDATALERLDEHFLCRDVGYLSTRNGWGDEASVFTFNAGPFLGVIHDHADNNSFTYIARGEPLVIDSAAANTQEEGQPASALGHNLVFIDGVGEHFADRGAGVDGAIVGFEASDLHSAVVGDATPSYNLEGYNAVRHAFRHAVFVKRPLPYLVTYDDIAKDSGAHDYEYLVHVPWPGDPGPGGTVGHAVIPRADGTPAGRIEFLHPSVVTAATQPFESRSGPFESHEVWRFAQRAVNPHFVVLFVPGDALDVPAPDVAIERAGKSLSIRLRWPYGTDAIGFSLATKSDSGRRFGGLLPRGRRAAPPATPTFTRTPAAT